MAEIYYITHAQNALPFPSMSPALFLTTAGLFVSVFKQPLAQTWFFLILKSISSGFFCVLNLMWSKFDWWARISDPWLWLLRALSLELRELYQLLKAFCNHYTAKETKAKKDVLPAAIMDRLTVA